VSDTVTYVEAIRLALRTALGDDERVLVLGGTSAVAAAPFGRPPACRRSSASSG